MMPAAELVPGFNVRGEDVKYLKLSNSISDPVIIDNLSPLSLNYMSMKRAESISSTQSQPDDFFLHNRTTSMTSTLTNASEFEVLIPSK